jgi:thymidylate synthase (FAD)
MITTKHRTWSYNEVSRRYTSDGLEFFVPKELRPQSEGEDKQQSDLDNVITTLEVDVSKYFPPDVVNKSVEQVLRGHANEAIWLYNSLIKQGVAREQARMVLPQNMYTEYYGTVNLHNLMHFIRLRTSDHAQWEIKQYALEMLHLIEAVAPVSVNAIKRTWK